MEETQAIDVLGALAQETRLRIVRYLVGRGDEGAPAGDIGKAVDATSSRASFHLSALERAGVISSERRSRNVVYRAELDRNRGLALLSAERLLRRASRHPGLLSARGLLLDPAFHCLSPSDPRSGTPISDPDRGAMSSE